MPNNQPSNAPLGEAPAISHTPNGSSTGNVQVPPSEQDFRDENARLRSDLQALTSRLDAMTIMMNQLMELAVTRAPMLQQQVPGNNIGSTPQATAYSPLPLLQTTGIQSRNYYSTQVQLQPAAPTPHQAAPAACQPLAEGGIPAQPQAGGSATLPSVRSRRSANTRCSNNRPPRGDADDLDEDEGESTHLPAGNRRGRGRFRSYAPPYLSRHPDPEAEDDPNDDYAVNRGRLETSPKSLSIEHFSSEDRSQDFNTLIQASITDYEADYLDQEPVQEREDANWDHQPVAEQGDSDWDQEPVLEQGDGNWDQEPTQDQDDGDWDQEPIQNQEDGNWDQEPALEQEDGNWDEEPIQNQDDYEESLWV